jgi:competence CoiA-like predicted nuclease
MQRYALSENGTRVFAEEALPQVDYLCPECQGKLRVRQGEIKIAHFFHYEGTRECRWRTRFQTHTIIQEILSQQLGLHYCTLECFFPEISRIADIAFHPQKIVFEIQISPISEKELIQRTSDYWKTGWHVIWILHIEQFGSKRASSAEAALQTIPHYFTDLGSKRGTLWDEASFVYKKKRIWFFPLSRIKLSTLSPLVHSAPPQIHLPSTTFDSSTAWLEYRKKSWSCSLEGDFLTQGCPSTLHLPKKMPSRSDLFLRIRTFFFLLWIKISGSRD